MIFWGCIIALVSTLFGQFFRLDVGGGGILFLDIFLPLLSVVWATSLIKENKNPFKILKKNPIFWPAFIFLSLAALSLFIAGIDLSLADFIKSAFYLFRYFFLLLFIGIVADILKNNPKKQKIFLSTVFLCAGVLAFLGFLQLKYYPSFLKMAHYGWDPHIGRLLSTWFDPNFLGGFLAFVLVLLTGIFAMWVQKINIQKIFQEKFLQQHIIQKNNFFFVFLCIVLLLALLLTFSRSALLAFIIPLFIIGILYFRILLITAIIGVILLLPFSPRAVERIENGVNSMISIVQDDQKIFLPDPSSRLRVINVAEGIELASKNFWTGVGFNTIRLHRKADINSSGGFDSSLLTILVSTGIFGLVSFLYLLFSIAKISFQKFLGSNRVIHKGVSLGFFCSIFGILAQSVFINSLFFSFFLVFFFGVLGWIIAIDEKK